MYSVDTAITTTELDRERFNSLLWKRLAYPLGVVLSLATSHLLLMTYQMYAANLGFQPETGCHGPELPFGMLSGIFHLFLLRRLSL
jgi:hypothetical protein